MTARGLALLLALLACAPTWARADDTPEVEAEVARRIREVQPLVDRGDFRAAIAALEAAPANLAASEAWAEDGARAIGVCRRHLREQERFEAAMAAFAAKDERPLVEWIRDVEAEDTRLGVLLFVDAWRAKARAALGAERYAKVVEQLRNDELQALDLETPDWPDGPDDGPPPPPPAPVRGSPVHTARLAALREAGQAKLAALPGALVEDTELSALFRALRAGDVATASSALAAARGREPPGGALASFDLARLERRAQPFRPAGATELEGGGLRLVWSFDEADELRDFVALGDLELRAEGGALRLAHGSGLVPLARVGGRWRDGVVVEAVAAVDTSRMPGDAARDPAPLVAIRAAGGVVVVPLIGDPTPCLLDRTGAVRLLNVDRTAQGQLAPRGPARAIAGQPVTVRASVTGRRLALEVEVGGAVVHTTDVAWVGSALEVLVGSVAPGRASIGQLSVQGQVDPLWLERARVARRVEAVHEAEVELRWPVPAGQLPAAWTTTTAEDEAGLDGTPQPALAELAAARAARAAGDLRPAQGCLSDALGRDPLFPAALYLSAQLALERDDAEAALAFADRALKAIDGFPEAERVRAAALLALGRVVEARSALGRARDANPADPLVWLLASELLLRARSEIGAAGFVERPNQLRLFDEPITSAAARAVRWAALLGGADVARPAHVRLALIERLAEAGALDRSRGQLYGGPEPDDVWLLSHRERQAMRLDPRADERLRPPLPTPFVRAATEAAEPAPRVVVATDLETFFGLAALAGLDVDPVAGALRWTARDGVLSLLQRGDGPALAALVEQAARLARERGPTPLVGWAARGEASAEADAALRGSIGEDVIARRNLELLAVAWARRTPWFDLVTEARRAIPWELDGVGAAQAWLLVAAAKDGLTVPSAEAGAPERSLAEVYAAWRAAVTAPGFTSRRLDHAWVSTFHALDKEALDARLGAWARAQAKARAIFFE
jgi:tetratricopeptide (TPR) repeat protein